MENSSSSSSSSHEVHFPRDEDGNFVSHISGLEYYPNFLSPQDQTELLALIDSNPWQEGVIARRQQFYGEIYYHTSFKSKVLQGCSGTDGLDENETNETLDGAYLQGTTTESIHSEDKTENESSLNMNGNDGIHQSANKGMGIPMDASGMRNWLDKTMPFFEQEGLMEPPSQVLINEYKNNMGIASHFEDYDAFGPVIVTISLVSPVYMTLKKPTSAPTIDLSGSNINACDTYDDVVKILLEPGSLLIMKHDARFKYRHGIGKYKWINLPPQPQKESSLSSASEEMDTSKTRIATAPCTRIKRDDSYRRVSLTIRHLLSTRRKVKEHEDESDTIKDPNVY